MKKLRLLILTIFFAIAFTVISPMDDLKAEGFFPWGIEKIIGKKAPDFTIKDLSGKSISLSSFKGKLILLNIWATWCPYCRKERAELNALHREYKDRGLVILSVSNDRSVEKVKRYVKKIPVDFIVLWDSDGNVTNSYGIRALPTNFLIDREGIIKHKLMGFRKWTSRSSKKLIEELLGK